MNANAPLEASNLNNPSPVIRSIVGDYRIAQIHADEEKWTYNTHNDTLNKLRTAASDRMKQRGANPTDSFDFLDDQHSRIPFPFSVAPITLQSIPLFIADTKNKTSQPPTKSPSYISSPMRQPQPDNTSTMDITHIQAPEQQLEDDTLSQLSNVSISKPPTGTASVSGSALQSATKRARHTATPTIITKQRQSTDITNICHTSQPIITNPTFVNFITDIQTHANTIRTSLLEAHTKATTISTADNTTPILPFPFEAIANQIHFAMIPGSKTTKLGLIRMNMDDHTDAVATIIQSLPTTINEVFVSSTPPATGYEIHHIDDSPPQNGSPYPLNCRIIGCQLHNLGREPNPASTPTNILTTLAQHAYYYHYDLIHDNHITTTTLERIGWYRCPGCLLCQFTKETATQHKDACKIYQQRNKYADLIQICPTHKQHELLTLIDNNSDELTIKSTVLDWLMTTNTPTVTNKSP